MPGEKSDARNEASPFRVLVVDDNRDSADSLAILLRMLGYDARAVYGGADAVGAARDFLPDCVLSDIGMPGMDGYALAGHLKRDGCPRGPTLIAITACADAGRAEEAGFSHHILKPADPAIVVALLGALLTVEQRLKRAEAEAQGGTWRRSRIGQRRSRRT